MNSKSEWNHSRLPRIVIEIGEEIEENMESGMARSTELGGKDRGKRSIKIKQSEKREGTLGGTGLTEGNPNKKQRVHLTETAKEGEKMDSRKKKVRLGGKRTWDKPVRSQERKEIDSGERLKGWLKAYGIKQGPLAEVKGVREHVDRIRGSNKKEETDSKMYGKVMVERGPFKFTFRKVEIKFTDEAIKTTEIGEERRREREEPAALSEDLERRFREDKTEDVKDNLFVKPFSGQREPETSQEEAERETCSNSGT